MGDITIQGVWSQQELLLHINVVEFMAVQLALQAFQTRVEKKVVLLQTDHLITMYYMQKQGDTIVLVTQTF